MRKVFWVVLTAAVLALPAWASADPRTFHIKKDGGSKAAFLSDAMLETINGVSSQVHGQVNFDPDDLSTVRGRLEIPVSSLRTGIDLRDEHLQSDNWLDAARHPNVVFEITGVEGASRLQPNQTTRLKIKGRFTVHGVTKNVTADARVKYAGDVLRAKARFPFELDDFNVSIPAPVRLKVSNEIQVQVDLRAVVQNGG